MNNVQFLDNKLNKYEKIIPIIKFNYTQLTPQTLLIISGVNALTNLQTAFSNSRRVL